MANRRFEHKLLSLESDPVTLWAVVTIGAAGAPTLTRGKGITSVTRSGTGQYYLTLQNKYYRFLGGTITAMRSGTYAHVVGQFEAQTVNTTGIVYFATYEEVAFVDPTSGIVLYISVQVGNSSV